MRYFLMLLPALLLTAPAGAQDLDPRGTALAQVRKGQLLRLHGDGAVIEYRFVASTDEALRVRDPRSGQVLDIDWDRIERLDVKRRRDAYTGAPRGAIVGGFIGAVAGLLSGYNEGDDPPYWFFGWQEGDTTAEAKAISKALDYGRIGAAAGAFLGMLVPGSQWRTVGVAKRITAVPTAGGVGVAIRL